MANGCSDRLCRLLSDEWLREWRPLDRRNNSAWLETDRPRISGCLARTTSSNDTWRLNLFHDFTRRCIGTAKSLFLLIGEYRHVIAHVDIQRVTLLEELSVIDTKIFSYLKNFLSHVLTHLMTCIIRLAVGSANGILLSPQPKLGYGALSQSAGALRFLYP
jgi:hypothetical protein